MTVGSVGCGCLVAQASFGILRGLRRLSGRPKTVIKFFKVGLWRWAR